MAKLTYIIFFSLLISCGQKDSSSEKNTVESSDSIVNAVGDTPVKTYILKDTTIKFLWRDYEYDEDMKDSVNTIFINEDYCKNISDPEKAALGYVATYIGNDCWWDGEAKDDRSNLKCKILAALNLGYQCSDNHLNFLRNMFKNDKQILDDLKNCPTVPYTSTIQDTFDEIILTVKGKDISVFFKANGINMREQRSWNWSQTDYFNLDQDNIRLVKTDKSKVNKERFEVGE